MSAQSARRAQNLSSLHNFLRMLVSAATDGYSCSKVKANLSRNASFNTLVPINLPSSDPLPFVLAVATTLNPGAGCTTLPTFFKNTPLPSKMDCKQSILLDARSTSSKSKTAPLSSASMTGPLCHTVSPLTRRNPPIRSSSSVSIVMFTRTNSLLS